LVDRTLKTLIFDLGGVILDLSIDDTLQAFTKLSGFEAARVRQIFQQSPEFDLYEKGKLTDGEFRDFIRNSYLPSATDQQIDECWNAMLRGLPFKKLQLLTELMKSYQVILLSNTNDIHLRYINQVLVPSVCSECSLLPFFHQTYYSHLMGMRKPDAEIFTHILNAHNLRPEETLFLDDNKFNIEGANALGIKTVHVTSPNFILDYFHA
jgi:putative hydrolase of the HAD superfamily